MIQNNQNVEASQEDILKEVRTEGVIQCNETKKDYSKKMLITE